MTFTINFDAARRDSYFAREEVVDGVEMQLRIGGRDHGWWCRKDTGERLHEAAPAELDHARSTFWGTATP
jgi:hypothetical protein